MSVSTDACCTCATLLDPPLYSSISNEKSYPPPGFRRLQCCSRAICSRCLQKNSRFESYCPFCQISSEPSPLPQGLKEPPSYAETTLHPTGNKTAREPADAGDQPPSYHTLNHTTPEDASPDVTHHLHPTDSLQSISLAYKVPAPILRQHNGLYSDNLLAARRTLQIPGSHYKGGVSLSPDPIESEEETEHKRKIRRFMVSAKCHQYDVAELYLKQARDDLEMALERWRDDERWEKENPLGAAGGKKGKRRSKAGSGAAIGLSWQLHS